MVEVEENIVIRPTGPVKRTKASRALGVVSSGCWLVVGRLNDGKRMTAGGVRELNDFTLTIILSTFYCF